MQMVPSAFDAFSNIQEGRSARKAYKQQAHVAQQQATADEEAVRRDASQVMGSQAAAFAQAGGGADLGVARQSAVNAELDALNLRYKGGIEAASLKAKGKAVERKGYVRAGQRLLTAYASYKSGSKVPTVPEV